MVEPLETEIKQASKERTRALRKSNLEKKQARRVMAKAEQTRLEAERSRMEAKQPMTEAEWTKAEAARWMVRVRPSEGSATDNWWFVEARTHAGMRAAERVAGNPGTRDVLSVQWSAADIWWFVETRIGAAMRASQRVVVVPAEGRLGWRETRMAEMLSDPRHAALVAVLKKLEPKAAIVSIHQGVLDIVAAMPRTEDEKVKQAETRRIQKAKEDAEAEANGWEVAEEKACPDGTEPEGTGLEETWEYPMDATPRKRIEIYSKLSLTAASVKGPPADEHRAIWLVAVERSNTAEPTTSQKQDAPRWFVDEYTTKHPDYEKLWLAFTILRVGRRLNGRNLHIYTDTKIGPVGEAAVYVNGVLDALGLPLVTKKSGDPRWPQQYVRADHLERLVRVTGNEVNSTITMS